MGTDYYDHLSMIENTEPIATQRSFQIKRFVSHFRRAADRWRQHSQETSKEELIAGYKLRTSCGKLIIEAHKAGVLPALGDLHNLIAFHSADDSNDPCDVEARLIRCPANLFSDFTGGNLIRAFNDNGEARIVGEPFGGVAPRLEPGILDQPENDRYAQSCEILADWIEHGHKDQYEDGSHLDEGNVICLSGLIWMLRFQGNEASIPHTPKSGLLYIRELIRNQGRYLSALDVAAVVTGCSRSESASIGDKTIDSQARLAYRKRFADLTLELEAAERNNDEGKAITLRMERDKIEAQLREALGLGGRPRRLGDNVDRAAKRVSTAISRAIDKIEQPLPSLALHLSNMIDTGRVLRYQPEDNLRWVC